jgi:hypothetical protein
VIAVLDKFRGGRADYNTPSETPSRVYRAPRPRGQTSFYDLFESGFRHVDKHEWTFGLFDSEGRNTLQSS